MWSFSTFKDIRYWILLIPAIIILVLFAVFTPDYILEKPYIPPILGIIFIASFLSTYYIWRYFGDKKKRDNMDDSSNIHQKNAQISERFYLLIIIIIHLLKTDLTYLRKSHSSIGTIFVLCLIL